MSALDSWIKRALHRGELMSLKGGLYVLSIPYLREKEKIQLHEFFASQIYMPSYISLEYALVQHGMLLPNLTPIPLTSVTPKSGRLFENFSGTYTYSNMKPLLFFGFEERDFRGSKYYVATKAKALFDYLYLKRHLERRNRKRLKKQLFEELGLKWATFSEADFEEFDRYVWKSNSKKMMVIWEILKQRFDEARLDREFAIFRRQLLG